VSRNELILRRLDEVSERLERPQGAPCAAPKAAPSRDRPSGASLSRGPGARATTP
jgi:hypothetical protein